MVNSAEPGSGDSGEVVGGENMHTQKCSKESKFSGVVVGRQIGAERGKGGGARKVNETSRDGGMLSCCVVVKCKLVREGRLCCSNHILYRHVMVREAGTRQQPPPNPPVSVGSKGEGRLEYRTTNHKSVPVLHTGTATAWRRYGGMSQFTVNARLSGGKQRQVHGIGCNKQMEVGRWGER